MTENSNVQLNELQQRVESVVQRAEATGLHPNDIVQRLNQTLNDQPVGGLLRQFANGAQATAAGDVERMLHTFIAQLFAEPDPLGILEGIFRAGLFAVFSAQPQWSGAKGRLHQLVEELPEIRVKSAESVLEALKAGNLDPAYVERVAAFIEAYRPALEALARP